MITTLTFPLVGVIKTPVYVPPPPDGTSQALAFEITLPYTATGSRTEDQVIWYKFTTTDARFIRGSMVGSNYDSYVILFNAAGDLIIENDDHIGAQSLFVTDTALPAGTYYLASLGCCPNSTGNGFAIDHTGGAMAGSAGNFTIGISALLTYPVPVVNTFSASQATVTGPTSVFLNWNVSWATTIVITDGIGTVVTSPVVVTETTVYTLTATGPSGVTTATLTITYTP